MTKVSDVYDYLRGIAPLELQMDFDNAGIQVGSLEQEVGKILVALDITNAVIDEALALGAQLIVSHHPLIFGGLNNVTAEGKGAKTLRLARAGISAISMHTNLDIAQGGVNDVLIELLGANSEQGLDADNCGRVGELPEPMEFMAFAKMCREKLNVQGLRYYNAGRPVKRLAVMGGAGGSEVQAAFDKGCDTYVTADVSYHQFQLADELKINLIDADHFCTENPIVPVLARRLDERFPALEVTVSKVHHQIASAL